MRLRDTLFLLIAACGPSPALEAPARPVVGSQPPPEPSSEEFELVGGFQMTVGVDAGPDGDVRVPTLEQSCSIRREKLVKFRAEYEENERNRPEWLEKHCKPTFKYHTSTDLSGRTQSSRGPERAWICVGKIVDSTDSKKSLYLAQRIADLQVFLREKCADRRGF